MNIQDAFVNQLLSTFLKQTSMGTMSYQFNASNANEELLIYARKILQDKGIKSTEYQKDYGHAWNRGRFVNFIWYLNSNLNLLT